MATYTTTTGIMAIKAIIEINSYRHVRVCTETQRCLFLAFTVNSITQSLCKCSVAYYGIIVYQSTTLKIGLTFMTFLTGNDIRDKI